jgi:hypothetical protein
VKRDIETLEIMQSAKDRLDERDDRRRERDEASKPNPEWHHRSEKHSDRIERAAKAEEEKARKAVELEAFRFKWRNREQQKPSVLKRSVQKGKLDNQNWRLDQRNRDEQYHGESLSARSNWPIGKQEIGPYMLIRGTF